MTVVALCRSSVVALCCSSVAVVRDRMFSAVVLCVTEQGLARARLWEFYTVHVDGALQDVLRYLLHGAHPLDYDSSDWEQDFTSGNQVRRAGSNTARGPWSAAVCTQSPPQIWPCAHRAPRLPLCD